MSTIARRKVGEGAILSLILRPAKTCHKTATPLTYYLAAKHHIPTGACQMFCQIRRLDTINETVAHQQFNEAWEKAEAAYVATLGDGA
jgi:hypothetical protein